MGKRHARPSLLEPIYWVVYNRAASLIWKGRREHDPIDSSYNLLSFGSLGLRDKRMGSQTYRMYTSMKKSVDMQ